MADFEKMNGESVSAPTLDNTAPRWKRFVAIFIDFFITTTCAGFFVDQEKFNQFQNEMIKYNYILPPEVAEKFISFQIHNLLLVFVIFFVLNGFLLYQRGQTIGKTIMKIAIRDLENKKTSFSHLVVMRYLMQLPMIILTIPSIADYFFIIVRTDRRSLHDLIAKTKVIDLSIQVAPSTPTFVA